MLPGGLSSLLIFCPSRYPCSNAFACGLPSGYGFSSGSLCFFPASIPHAYAAASSSWGASAMRGWSSCFAIISSPWRTIPQAFSALGLSGLFFDRFDNRLKFTHRDQAQHVLIGQINESCGNFPLVPSGRDGALRHFRKGGMECELAPRIAIRVRLPDGRRLNVNHL